MSRPPSPQFVETRQGWSWTWKTPEGIPDTVTGHQVMREVELEWLRNDEAWRIRSRVDKGGWCPAREVGDDEWEEPLDEPESWDHADALARRYADRP